MYELCAGASTARVESKKGYKGRVLLMEQTWREHSKLEQGSWTMWSNEWFAFSLLKYVPDEMKADAFVRRKWISILCFKLRVHVEERTGVYAAGCGYAPRRLLLLSLRLLPVQSIIKSRSAVKSISWIWAIAASKVAR